jgi:CubicO group peptidase (beta-lactamase class C family)
MAFWTGMSRWLSLLTGAALTLAFAAPAAAAARPAYDPAPVEAATRDLVAGHGLDGASVRLARGGQVLHVDHVGTYGPDTRVAIASASKWLSALTLARLVEAGTLRWDSRVGEFFPDAPAATRDISLTQLFSHTSGITIDDAGCLSDRRTTLQACARQILELPLEWAPGTAFAYGGNSMQVAGAMAEIASGRTWDALFLAEMVGPLGLTATDWTAGANGTGYVPNPNPRIGGGARSTLDDYGRIVDMLLAGGLHEGQAFLAPQTLATMALDRTVGLVVAASPVPEYGYGYGFGQWVEAKDASGATYRVSSPGAFGFTPWVDWRSGSNGVILVFGSGSAMRDELTALENLCLRQLDFVRRTQGPRPVTERPSPPAIPRPEVPLPARRPPEAHDGESSPPFAPALPRRSAQRPSSSPAAPPTALDAERRAH